VGCSPGALQKHGSQPVIPGARSDTPVSLRFRSCLDKCAPTKPGDRRSRTATYPHRSLTPALPPSAVLHRRSSEGAGFLVRTALRPRGCGHRIAQSTPPVGPVAHLPEKEGMVRLKPAAQRLHQWLHLRDKAALRQLCQNSGSVSPATSASNMARPETPSTSETTFASLMLAVFSSLCTRFVALTRSRTRLFRCRVRSRKSRMGGGGMKLARMSPCARRLRSTRSPSRRSSGPAPP
jgi:hypothetical protein